MYSGMTCNKEVEVFMFLWILIMRRQSEMIHNQGRQGWREQWMDVHLDKSLLMYSGMTCNKEVGVFMFLWILITRRQSEMIHNKGRQGCREQWMDVHLDKSLLMYSGMTCNKEVGVFMFLWILIMRRQSEMIHIKGRQGCREQWMDVHLENRTLLYSGMTCK